MLVPLTFAGAYAYVKQAFEKMFEERTTSRRVALAVLAVVVVQTLLKFMPDTSFGTSVALLLVSFVSLGGLVSALRRDIAEGVKPLTQRQEDVLAVVLAALFWITFIMGLRVFIGADYGPGTSLAHVHSPAASRGAAAGVKPWSGVTPRLVESGCVPGWGKVCIIEEWFY